MPVVLGKSPAVVASCWRCVDGSIPAWQDARKAIALPPGKILVTYRGIVRRNGWHRDRFCSRLPEQGFLVVADVDAMLLASLSLSSGITGGDPILLVPSLRWHSLRDEYREVDPREVLWRLHDLLPRRSRELRSFLAQAQLGNLALERMDDQQVLALLRHALRDRRLRAIQRGKPSSAAPDATAGLCRLVRQLERETRGKLSHRGRSYKLVVGDDLARTPNRDAYTVVTQADARACSMVWSTSRPPRPPSSARPPAS
jgi:hypothetical protein